MLDFFRTGLPSVEAASPELRKLKKELSDAEAAYRDAVERIRAIRAELADSRPIPPGSPMERRKQPQAFSPQAQKAVEQAAQDRDQARAKIEPLKTQIIEATSAAMRKICADTRPSYEKRTSPFLGPRLTRLQEEIVAIEAVNAIRMNLEARQVRIMGLPPFTDEQKAAIERSAKLRSEVNELLEEGALQRCDLPKELVKAWRLA